MEVFLILACFISNAFALDNLYKDRKKITGILIIVNLCLTVALAYQFDQIKNIFYVILAAAAIVVAFFGIKFYIKRKNSEAVVINNKEIENHEDL